MTKKQRQAWVVLNDQETQELIFGGGAGGGKTNLGVGWLITNCGRYPGTRWLMGRARLKALKDTTLASFFDLCAKWELRDQIHYVYNAQSGVIKWRNGSEILLKDLFLYPQDPNFDSLGSLEISGAFIDEVNQIVFKAWEIVRSRIRYRLDEYNLYPKILGTCNPAKNWVKSEFYTPHKEGKLDPHRAFIQALVTDNPFISRHYVNNLRSLKDKATKERLLFGNWEYDDDPSALFDYDAIMDLFTNKPPEWGDDYTPTRYITGDISRKGRDKAVFILWEDWQAIEIIVLDYERKSNLDRTKEWLIGYAEDRGVRRSNILLDEDGVGGGLVDSVGCKGFINNSAAIQPKAAKFDTTKRVNFANLKSQCYFFYADMVENGLTGIDEDGIISYDDELGSRDAKDQLVEELGAIKQKDADKDGKVMVNTKPEIKELINRSPDFSDALMMRAFFEVSKRPKPGVI